MDKPGVEIPFEVVQRQVLPSYIYRLPHNPDLCYRFAAKHLSKNETGTRFSYNRVVCPGCRLVYAQKMKQKQPIPNPNSRKFDPALGHVDGCEPVKYTDTIKIYSNVTDHEKKPKPYAFLLDNVVRTDMYGLIHRSKEDPTKCHRFFFVEKKDEYFSVACTFCKLSKQTYWAYKVNERGFLEDPELHHVNGCRPEILTEKYMTIDNDAAKPIIDSWIQKDDEIAIEKNGPDQRGNSLGVVETKKPITYLYRIPESDECFIFHAGKCSLKSLSLICKICNRNYSYSRKNRDKNPPKNRTSDGLSLKDNPLLEHRTDCKPIKYSLAIKEHKVIESENQPVGEYGYQLIKLRAIGGLQVIHKLKNEPTKCFIFEYYNRSKSSCLLVRCIKCRGLEQRMREEKRKKLLEVHTSSFRHRVTETGFLDEPSTRHHPNCTPFCYETTMKKCQYVDEATARGFISKYCSPQVPDGTYEPSVITGDQKEMETDYPALVVQKRNAVSFVYAWSGIAYIFHQLNHGDNSRLFCATCLSPDDIGPNADVAIRFSDGFSMEMDPRMNHLEHCRPPTNYPLWRGCRHRREDGAESVNRKYEFPLVKRSTRENYSAIYRMPDDPTQCYAFKSKRYVLKSRYLLVSCSGCCAAARKNLRQTAKKISAAGTYRLTSSGFLDDPTLRHIPGCEKLRFEDIVRENVITEGQESHDFFKHIYTSTQTHGIFVQPRSKANHNSSDLCEPFSKIFDIPFFTEDEVKVSLVGQTIMIKCQREVSAVGVLSGFLIYSIELPSSVDISTIETIWQHGQIILTAQRIL